MAGYEAALEELNVRAVLEQAKQPELLTACTG
jgi:hypothetical protein